MSTAPTQTKQANALDTIDAMLKSIGPEKTAETSHTEAGGFQGETEHPVKKEDDGTEPAYEGSRASENEEDVKEEQSPNEVVGDTPVDKSSAEKKALGLGESVDQDAVQLNIGTLQKATGEDPASETQKAKGGKEDSADGDGGSQGRGQTSHPARTSNDEIDGHKWSSAIGELIGQIKTAGDLGTEAIAAISVDADGEVRAKVASMQKTAMCEKCSHDPCTCEGKEATATTTEPTAAEKAAADLAGAVGGETQPTAKQAQDQQVVNDIAETITTAYQMAEKTAAFLAGVREKQAMTPEEEEQQRQQGDPGTQPPGAEPESEAPPEEMGGEEMGGGEMGGGMEGPPAPGGMGGGGEEEALLQALTGAGGGGPEMGGGMPGGDPMAGGMPGQEMGGMPGGGMPGGGMPGMPGPEMGGMGGMGGQEMGGQEMGGQIGGEELAMLAAALDEAGITPQQLEMAATQKAAHDLKKAASVVERTSKWRPKTANEASRYQSILNHVREVCNTSS